MEHNGWIKLHRILLDKAIWKDSSPEQKTILVTLLLMANHTDSEWEWKGDRFHCSPGQFRTSLDSIAAACGKGISIQNVRTALKKFEKYGFLICNDLCQEVTEQDSLQSYSVLTEGIMKEL